MQAPAGEFSVGVCYASGELMAHSRIDLAILHFVTVVTVADESFVALASVRVQTRIVQAFGVFAAIIQVVASGYVMFAFGYSVPVVAGYAFAVMHFEFVVVSALRVIGAESSAAVALETYALVLRIALQSGFAYAFVVERRVGVLTNFVWSAIGI